jgi:hypothetical protein
MNDLAIRLCPQDHKLQVSVFKLYALVSHQGLGDTNLEAAGAKEPCSILSAIAGLHYNAYSGRSTVQVWGRGFR